MSLSSHVDHPVRANVRDREKLRASIIQVLAAERDSLTTVIEALPDSLVWLAERIISVSGRLVFSGMGKSGFVARKLVATFSSLGMPSLFLHPAEALHGDLGMVTEHDFFIALSKSGTGSELEYVIAALQQRGITTSLLCCREGNLNKRVDYVVVLPLASEACVLNLAPTSSSTLMLACGDALASACSSVRGFSVDDFARVHPAGALGKRLILTVRSLMHTGQRIPFVHRSAPFEELLYTMTSKKLGMCVVGDEQVLEGVITDGDLRRSCEREGKHVFDETARDIMRHRPKTISPDVLAIDALEFMEEHAITSLVVQEAGRIVGVVHIHDILKSGVNR